MTLSKQDLIKIAEIARLRLDQGELEKLEKDACEILEYCAKISEIEGGGNEAYFARKSLKAKLRKDKTKDCDNADEIKTEFCKSQGGFMASPKSL